LNNNLLVVVVVSLLYTLVGSVYYLKIMKVCYVDNPTSWGVYGKISSTTAYVIAFSVFVMMIGLWHGNFLF
jgi:NADH:ubiquinone oxidoreductase subunit 2 (subunit N)